ncbi:spindle and kinetochore-associated protein 1-like [Oppia nitens]|uniref:spindle and kinetochore-associated protein 1-like n=1 Tax=Oppia nitens TaxID=1686743 RepID=UPI0023DAA52E|nr:spindle and kinetochore-associated protein 1-like [Oppia nitens]
MNCFNLDQLLAHFDQKISLINELFPLSQLYDNESNGNDNNNEWQRNVINTHNSSYDYYQQMAYKKPDLKEMSQMVIEMKAMTQEIKSLLRQEKQKMLYFNNKYHNDLDIIGRHCVHINDNIPTFLQKNEQNKGKINENQSTKRQPIKSNNQSNNRSVVSKVMPKANNKVMTKSMTNIKTTQESRIGGKSITKKTVIKETKCLQTPNISFITTEEFESIPQYILGRLSYEVMNRTVADFNRTIAAKYKIIANYSTKYSDEDMRRYSHFKEQENSETDGEFFCTINDLKDFSDLKVELTIRKTLTCLRHCKRIKEIRGNPSKLIRYAIVKDSCSLDFNDYQ